VKESGRIFAAPTFLFLTMIGSLIVIGIVKLASGTLGHAATGGFRAGWAAEHAAAGVEPLAVIGLFLGLHALASGSTAMTGVEAISNGVPAFRPPEWRNARTTLMWMGGLLGTMFLGISFLAQKVQAVPDPTQQQTVLAEIGRTVYGTSTLGHVLFYVLQIATTMVLVLAANTAFADFPRLASFQAGDDFLPRQFTTRGHRLVFSNGIVALSLAAAALVIAFGGDVAKLIPFYAIGVFTSFTLSQAGMAKRHLRIREPHWRVGLLINGLGAVATGVVLLVIAITKFTHGAWAVIVLVPIMVYALIRLARQYQVEQETLQRDLERFSTADLKRPAIVLMVDQVDSKTIHALQYAKTIRADDVRAVHIEEDPLRTLQLETAWRAAGLSEIPLKILRRGGDGASRLAGFVCAMPEDRDVNVLIPVPHETSARERISEARAGARLTKALLPYERVRVTLVRDHPDGVHPLTYDDHGKPVVRLAPRGQHTAIVLVDKLDSAVLRAVRYPLTLGATEVWAVHAAVDPDRAGVLVKKWMDAKMPVPLDVIECWDRNVTRALEAYVLSRADRGTEVTVVMARRDFPKLRQRLLHDRTSSKIMRALGRYPHIDIARVPYYFAPTPAADTSVAPPAGVR
jgi:hypothetical protein